MKQNLTLTLDADLLKAARKLALDRDTSVNQLVRDFLEQEVRSAERRKGSVERMKKLFKTAKLDISGTTWKRDELYNR